VPRANGLGHQQQEKEQEKEEQESPYNCTMGKWSKRKPNGAKSESCGQQSDFVSGKSKNTFNN